MVTNSGDTAAQNQTPSDVVETSTTTSATTPEPAEDLAALRAAAAELAALKAEGAAARKADREARKRAQEEAERSGELAKALEAAKSRLAELEGIEPLAARWRAHEEAETRRLDTEAAGLPEAVRALYADASSVEAKAKVLAAFRAAPGAPQVKAVGTPPAMGAPASVSSVDVESALADPTGKKIAELKARDPSAVANFFASILGPKSNNNSLGIGRFQRAPSKAQ